MKLAVNINTLFREVGGIDKRYEAAKECGFDAVETAFPYESSLEKLVEAKERLGLKHVLISSPPGDWEKGDRGLACIAERLEEFRESIVTSIEYAKALDCKLIHVMSGLVTERMWFEEAERLYISNLKWAVQEFSKNDMTCVIEPIAERKMPGYLASSIKKAIRYCKCVPNLRILLDIAHVQQMNGDITKVVTDTFPYTAHIQISQVPNRDEPGNPGEIQYPYVFSLLNRLNYQGYVGLEYVATEKASKDSFGWIEQFGLSRK